MSIRTAIFLLLTLLMLHTPLGSKPAAAQTADTAVQWRPFIEQITVNGRPVSVQRAVVALTTEQLVAQLQNQWSTEKQRDSLPVKVDQSGPWTIVSRIYQGQLESAQIRAIGGGQTEVLRHITSLMPSANQDAAADAVPRWITPDFKVTFTTQSLDQGQRASTYLLATPLSVESAIARLAESFKTHGFAPHPTANQSFKDQAPAQGMQIVMASRSGAHITAQAMTSLGKTSVLVFFKS